MTSDPDDGTRAVILAPTAIEAHQTPRKVEFADLPRVVQDRFVAATEETFPPWPILRAHARAPASRGWTLVAIGAVLALIALVLPGFGDPFSTLATHPRWALGLFAVLVALAVLGALRALAAHGARDLPFRAGVYVFPSELVDARTPTLWIHPLGELRSIETGARTIRLHFRGGRAYAFDVPELETAESAVAQVLRAREALEQGGDAPSLLGLVDPLFEPTEGPPIALAAPFRVRWSFWVQRRAGVTVAAALILGPLAFVARDTYSDRAAFAKAAAGSDPAALRAYADHGRRHVAEVRGRLLPLVELRALHDTAAIERWMRDHPVAAATDEAKDARRAALSRDAARLSTLAAIRAYAAAHAGDGPQVEADITEALRRLHARVTSSRVGSVAIEQLLGQPSACGTGVAIEIVRGSGNLRKADRAVSESRRFAGSASFPSLHLTAAPGPEREARELIAARIGAVFPEGCLVAARAAPAIAATAAPAIGVRTATLRLTWTPRFAGTVRTSNAPPAVFADLAFDVDIRLLGQDGRALSHARRTIGASVTDASLTAYASLVRQSPFDDAIERGAYEDVLLRVLTVAARDAATWLLGEEPTSPVAPL